MVFDFFYQSFSKENVLVWNLMSGEFQSLSIGNIFQLSGAWMKVGAYFTNINQQ
jgi:hypothetical protein